MPTLRQYTYWEATDASGEDYRGGSRSCPVETTIDGYIEQKTVSLADDTTLDLWDSSGSLTDFEFFWLKADQDVQIELTVDRGAEVGTVVVAIILPANKDFVLNEDGGLANYTADFATGSADVIDRLRVRNESGEVTTLEYALVT